MPLCINDASIQEGHALIPDEIVSVSSSRPKRIRRPPAALQSDIYDLDTQPAVQPRRVRCAPAALPSDAYYVDSEPTVQLKAWKRRRLSTVLTDDSGFEESDRNSLSPLSNHSHEEFPADKSANKLQSNSKFKRKIIKDGGYGKKLSKKAKKHEKISTSLAQMSNDRPVFVVQEDIQLQPVSTDQHTTQNPLFEMKTNKISNAIQCDTKINKLSIRQPSTSRVDIAIGPGCRRERKESDSSRTSRMHMREWIEWNADNNTFTGLKWLDRDEKLIQIAWKHGSRNEWSRDDVLHFESWADYTGNNKSALVD